MPGTTQKVIQLGCDPVVELVITEDDGNLLFQLFSEDPNTDIDGFFFNLNDDALAGDLTIYPKAEAANGDVIDFRAEPGILNQLDNLAQTQEVYDVEVQFGTDQYTNSGQINDTGFTLYLDSLEDLSLDDIDMSKFVAVVNSDGGQGIALVGGETGTVSQTVVAVDEDFDDLVDPAQSDDIVRDDGWRVYNGELKTFGGADGVLQFAPVETDGPVSLSFDIRGQDMWKFEESGCYADKLTVQVKLDDGTWQTLDEFVVNEHTDMFVGSNTGQTFGADSTTISYSGGILDNVSDNAEFRFVSDISAYDERLFIDNVKITATEDGHTGETELVESVALNEDFDHVWAPEHSDAVVHNDGWDVRYDQLFTNGCNDGKLVFDEVQTDGKVEFSFDARGINIDRFENWGCNADNLRVEVQIDNGDWQLLDEFMVNDQGTALVGSETGQEITSQMSGLNYSGGVLDSAEESVQFRLVSDISYTDEKIKIDNVEVRTIEEVPADHSGEVCEDFEAGDSGDVVDGQFDGFTVSAQRAWDHTDSENDAMLFDTAKPTGYDWDLHYADQGNAVIISEDNDSNDADDNWSGGTISFSFDEPSEVTSLKLLDVEEHGGAIDMYDVDGNLLSTLEIPTTGNNGSVDLEINVENVSIMDVHLAGSGAVDDLCYIPQSASDDGDDAYCDQYMVTYDDLKPDEDLPEEEEMVDDLMV